MIERILDCTREFLFLYLSIPIRLGKLRREDWLDFLRNFQKRLDGCQWKLLSLGGDLTFLNAVLSSTPLYHLSFFRIPVWVKNRIARIRKKLL